LLVSTICCDSLINSKASQVKVKEARKPCSLENVQVQQEKIMTRLERIETKFKRRKLRREKKNRI